MGLCDSSRIKICKSDSTDSAFSSIQYKRPSVLALRAQALKIRRNRLTILVNVRYSRRFHDLWNHFRSLTRFSTLAWGLALNLSDRPGLSARPGTTLECCNRMLGMGSSIERHIGADLVFCKRRVEHEVYR